jgi:hypothetical protein
MSTRKLYYGAAVLALAASLQSRNVSASSVSPESQAIEPAALDEIRSLYRKLIDAENRHDLAAMRTMVWDSPNALFVAKTATPAEGNWAGFWGTDVVVEHLGDLYKAGPFRIDPDYDKERVADLSRDVIETYAN